MINQMALTLWFGKTGKVTQDIIPIDGVGQIKVEGETWSAVSENSEKISKDTEIIIKEIRGVKAVVMPK